MNWGELYSNLDRYLKRSDLSDMYPLWADLAGKRIDASLRLAETEYRTITVPRSQFIELPGDFIEMRHLEVNYQGGAPVEYVTAGQLDQMRAKYGTSGHLRWYTILNGQLELLPAPGADSEQVLTMYYYAKLAAPGEVGDTNKVLTAFPQLYLYGALIEAAAFREHQADAQTYTALWQGFADSLAARQQAGRFSGDNLTMRAV